MKTIIILLISLTTYSQGQLGVYGDVRNAAFGSAPTNYKSQLNWMLKGSLIAYSGAPIKVGVLYEEFNAIDFIRWGLELGYSFKISDKIRIETTADLTKIDRKSLHITSISWGVNAETIYFITDNLGVVILCSYTDRNDIKKWVPSTYVGLVWKFNQYKQRN